MSDIEEFTVERQTEPVKKKQKRTPAQLEALKRARLARSIKAQQRRQSYEETYYEEPSVNLTYFLGVGLLSLGGLAGYYYLKSQEKQKNSQENLKPQEPVVIEKTKPVIQRIVQPISEIKDKIQDMVKEELEKMKPTEPEPIPEQEPEPVLEPEQPKEPTAMEKFLTGAKTL